MSFIKIFKNWYGIRDDTGRGMIKFDECVPWKKKIEYWMSVRVPQKDQFYTLLEGIQVGKTLCKTFDAVE